MAGTEQNKTTIRRFWEEVFNARNLDAIDSLFTTDCLHHGLDGQEMQGKENLRRSLNLYFKAFPDIHASVEDIFAEGDQVVSRATCRGTHQGELMGVGPTGKQVSITILCVSRFVGERIAEDWGMLQLGVTPPAAQK